MMKMIVKRLRKLLILFSLLIALSVSIVLACGGWDDFGYSYSDFAPEPHVDTSYTPLFYSSYEMFYDIWYDGGFIDRFNSEILVDWYNFLNYKVNKDDLAFLLFTDSSTKVVEDLYRFFSEKQQSENSVKWAGKIDYKNNEVKACIEFLHYAKQIEASSKMTYDYWDYENAVKPKPVDPEIITSVIQKYETVKNPFLQNRYWFQAVKALFYSDQKSAAIHFFESSSQKMPKNTLYYRAMSYLAGIHYQLKDYAMSNYLYSIVFDKCISMRTTATYCFHPQNESDWNQALLLAKSPDEKAALWAVLGYYKDEGRSIKEIYSLNPKSPHLDFLLTRFINKMEEGIPYQGETNANDNKSKNSIHEYLDVVNTIAQKGNTNKPYLWNLAAGYLYTIAGNQGKSRILYQNAEKQLPAGKEYKNQLRLLRLITDLSETKKMDQQSENKLVSELKWLYHELPNSAGEKFRYSKTFNGSKKYISGLYQKQGNAVFAQLFNPAVEFYHDRHHVENMKAFLEKETKNSFEELAVSIYPITIDDIYEYQAVISTFENKIEQAYTYIQKSNTGKNIMLKANPFNGFIKDCHDCEHAMPQKTKFSKMRLIEIIQIMQNKVKNGEDLFNNNLLLANVFYNISFFGNARLFYEGNIIGDGSNALWDVDNYYQNMINSMANAKYYYEKALQAATTNEQKAKCYYMLAKCQRNDFYNGIGKNEINQNYDFLDWDGFRLLKNKYANTKFYQEVLRECGYFEKYVKN